MNKLTLLAVFILSVAIVLASAIIAISNRYSFHVYPSTTITIVLRFDKLTGEVEAVSTNTTLKLGAKAQNSSDFLNSK